MTTLIATLLPWILIIGFFVYLNKRMRDQMGGDGPGGGIFGVGKSKAKKVTAEDVQVTFNEVAGLPTCFSNRTKKR